MVLPVDGATLISERCLYGEDVLDLVMALGSVELTFMVLLPNVPTSPNGLGRPVSLLTQLTHVGPPLRPLLNSSGVFLLSC